MTTIDTTDVATIPRIDHAEAMKLQATELDRAIELLRGLDAEQWATQTNCPDWDVRRMWLHVLGACDAGASMRENAHQMRVARKRRKQLGVSLEGGLSGVQVAEREHLDPDELVRRLEEIAPKTVKGRSRTPRLMRAVKIPIDAPVVEKWALGYLIDIIYSVMPGCIESTPCRRPGPNSCSPPSTTAASSPTWLPSGPDVTVSRSTSS